ncbi:SDR family oxidoreductase [Paraburkholderia oxyphila]|uniref:SDR family oxidoreductase n=1 Tax=Paraburkholderia oxyphila TaxID=614212 RepID=UPI0012ED4CAA|nr:SDR family oxidoreductase [Paraburkholderia oxyphila]
MLLAAAVTQLVGRRSRKWCTPLGRVGVSSEMAGALLFFASSATDPVTGKLLVIDGGFHVATDDMRSRTLHSRNGPIQSHPRSYLAASTREQGGKA